MIRLLRHARMRLFIDRILNRLARDREQPARAVNAILRLLFPAVAAAVEFRAGNLARAEWLAPRGSRTAKRSQEMLQRLEAEFPACDAPDGQPPTDFNGRVLFVVHSTPSYEHNGYAVRSCQIVRAMTDAGVEMSLVARFGYPWDLPGRFQYPNCGISEYQELRFHHMRDPALLISTSDEAYLERYSAYLEGLADRFGCSVIHSNSNFLNGIAGARAARARGCMAVYEMRGLWHVTRTSSNMAYGHTEHYRYCERMELEAAMVSDRVIVISTPLKDWLVERGVAESKIWVIGNAADVGRVRVLERPHWEGSFRLGYIGSLVAYEGLDVLLHAMRLLHDSGVSVTLEIAGDGPDRSRLLAVRDSLKLQDDVRFLGRVPAECVADLYARMDACPLPRRRLPVTELVPPLKPFEVMAYGVPVVASALPPIAEIVLHGRTGVLCDPDSAESLAAAIRTLRDDPDACRRYANAARLRIESEFTWGENTKLYLSVYKNALSASPSG